jgi:hypothetical protein
MLVIPRIGWFAERFKPSSPQRSHIDKHGRQRIYIAYGGDPEESPVTHRGWRMAAEDEDAGTKANPSKDPEDEQ